MAVARRPPHRERAANSQLVLKTWFSACAASLRLVALRNLPQNATASTPYFKFYLAHRRHSGLSSNRMNLSPFTKDFRGEGHFNESYNYFSCSLRRAFKLAKATNYTLSTPIVNQLRSSLFETLSASVSASGL